MIQSFRARIKYSVQNGITATKNARHSERVGQNEKRTMQLKLPKSPQYALFISPISHLEIPLLICGKPIPATEAILIIDQLGARAFFKSRLTYLRLFSLFKILIVTLYV